MKTIEEKFENTTLKNELQGPSKLKVISATLAKAQWAVKLEASPCNRANGNAYKTEALPCMCVISHERNAIGNVLWTLWIFFWSENTQVVLLPLRKLILGTIHRLVVMLPFNYLKSILAWIFHSFQWKNWCSILSNRLFLYNYLHKETIITFVSDLQLR